MSATNTEFRNWQRENDQRTRSAADKEGNGQEDEMTAPVRIKQADLKRIAALAKAKAFVSGWKWTV